MASETTTDVTTVETVVTTTETVVTTTEMELDSVNPCEEKVNGLKRGREEEEEEKPESETVTEGEEKSVEEVRVEKAGDENIGPVGLGPKTFGSSVEMFNYFFNFLHHWPLNVPASKYEHMVLLDLVKKGHSEPDKKIGSGVTAFEIRNHPMYQSRCFFVVREDKSAEDFSFRKCVDQILPLPENMKMNSDSNGNGKKSGGRGGGGRGGGRGGGGGWGRGGRSRR